MKDGVKYGILILRQWCHQSINTATYQTALVYFIQSIGRRLLQALPIFLATYEFQVRRTRSFLRQFKNSANFCIPHKKLGAAQPGHESLPETSGSRKELGVSRDLCGEE